MIDSATEDSLAIDVRMPVIARHAGLFVSRGKGIHPTRTIDTHELFFVKQGTLHIREEQQSFRVGAGEALVLRAGREHGGTRDYSPELQFYWIHFQITEAKPISPDARMHVPRHRVVGRPDRLEELLRRYLDDQESGGLTPRTASLLVALMLSELGDSRPPGVKAGRAAAMLASRTLMHIRTHFHEDISTAVLAGLLHCNPDYLGRIFKQVQGITITEAIHRHRLRHARRLLLDREMNIDRVAREAGYTDPGYFRRVFRRYSGLTPGAFRRLYGLVAVNTE
jgi:AraC-like DNA-binding protein